MRPFCGLRSFGQAETATIRSVSARRTTKSPGSESGSRTDLIVAVSACPNDRNPQNGRSPSDLLVRVFAD